MTKFIRNFAPKIDKKDMKKLIYLVFFAAIVAACGQSYEETKRITRLERQRLAREDSAALKVAVIPTLDCLPFFVARHYNLFDSLGADIRLKAFSSHIDCDTAILFDRVEVAASDLVRAERMKDKGKKLHYLTATDGYWLLITNRNSRIKELKHLADKMMAMTRYSVTDMLGDHAVDSAKLDHEKVFRVQINDVRIRLRMLQNNEMDALFLPEPQATEALAGRHKTIMDSRKLDWKMGVIVAREFEKNDTARQRQLKALEQAYDAACDSINKYGVAHYSQLVARLFDVKEATADSIRNYKYHHYIEPREKDIERARMWLKKKQ